MLRARITILSELAPTYPLFRGSGLSSKLADIEAILGLVFTGFVTLGVVMGVSIGLLQLMIYHRPSPPAWLWYVLAPSGLLTIWLQWKTLRAIGERLEHSPHPRPVTMAMSQPNYWNVLCPLVGMWWLGQCAMMVLAANALSHSYSFVNATAGMRAFELILQLTILFMGTYAATSSMLFGLAAMWRSETLLTGVWKARLFVDVAITLLVSTFRESLHG